MKIFNECSMEQYRSGKICVLGNIVFNLIYQGRDSRMHFEGQIALFVQVLIVHMVKDAMDLFALIHRRTS